jgi:hypothetical protein
VLNCKRDLSFLGDYSRGSTTYPFR